MTPNYKELDAEKLDFVAVAEEAEVRNGERIFVAIDDYNLVVFNIAGQLFAIGDVCSHDDGPVGEGELDDHQIICPRHGARFDVRNGHVLTPPAVVDIPAYPVRVAEGMIEVGVPAE